jgi:hypothetical protein
VRHADLRRIFTSGRTTQNSAGELEPVDQRHHHVREEEVERLGVSTGESGSLARVKCADVSG